MRESLLKEIQAEYERIRADNHVEEARRLAEATAADRQIGELVAERMRLFQDGARSALGNPAGAQHITSLMVDKITNIQRDLRDRLVQNGFDENYLQPVYQCTDCHDTGYVGDLVRERCTCYTQKIRSRVASQAGLGLDTRETFETYDETVYLDKPLKENPADTQRTFMARMRALCETYAMEFPGNVRRNLLMFGMSGLGKTYLLNCIGNRVHARGYEVTKVTAYQLSQHMRASVFDNSPDGFTMLLDTPLLLLDDLGVEPLYNNITIEHLYSLLNERSLRGLHTIVSTNLTLNEMEKRYTERVCSRMFDKRNTVLLEFRGTDVRLG